MAARTAKKTPAAISRKIASSRSSQPPGAFMRAASSRRGPVSRAVRRLSAHLLSSVARLWWSDLDSFVRDSQWATDERLIEMRRWAEERELGLGPAWHWQKSEGSTRVQADAEAAEDQMDGRGLLWGSGT
jgi:hypothetical protein